MHVLRHFSPRHQCLRNIKCQKDIGWVRQNTTLYYGVGCQKGTTCFGPLCFDLPTRYLFDIWYCRTCGLRSGFVEHSVLVGRDAVSLGECLPTFKRGACKISVERPKKHATPQPLKMKAILPVETSGKSYPATQRYIPNDPSSQSAINFLFVSNIYLYPTLNVWLRPL